MRDNMVAISGDFLSAFADIPRQKQGKVIDFMMKFRQNPMSAGINYEKIRDARNPNLHSVRIDDTYRAIVLKPETGNVYVLLWVDHHDKAYDWARRKQCIINPNTGTLQIYDVIEAPGVATTAPAAGSAVPLFAEVDDDSLLCLGVPYEMLGTVKQVSSIAQLHDIQNLLPQEAYEGLTLIADGFDAEEVIQELFGVERVDEPEVDVDDFAAALNTPGSKQLFYVIEGEKELSEMLAAPLEKWRVFLHPSQRRLVEKKFSGPVRALGGAGTGKTVVAMHRAKWLAKNVFRDPRQRILFTTYTSNLASDIQENLKKICDASTLHKIEVVNLDAWVSGFLRSQGYENRIVYGAELDELWNQAYTVASPDLGLSVDFYKDEWNKVIKPQEVESLEDYVKASRVGRGVRLDRKARIAAWDVFEELKHLMNERRLRDAQTAMTEARYLLERQKGQRLYAAVIVDEAQDFSVQAMKLVRAIAGDEHANDLFIVGDAHQRIYQKKVTLKKCGINIQGRSSVLKINYRTTEETRAWAMKLLLGIPFDDLDEGLEEGKGYISLMHGPEPEVHSFGSFTEEIGFVIERLRLLQEADVDLRDICIVTRTNKQLDLYSAQLTQAGLRVYEIKRSKAEDRSIPGVRVATMHRVKGLEFGYIFVVGVNDGQVPLAALQAAGDKLGQAEAMTAERSLLYVAVTRAKRAAVVTSYGKKSPFI